MTWIRVGHSELLHNPKKIMSENVDHYNILEYPCHNKSRPQNNSFTKCDN